MQISCYNLLMVGPGTPVERRFSSFGALLRFLRKRSGMAQAEIAGALGVAQSTLSNYERMAESPNDPFIVGQIAEIFDVPPVDIEAKVLHLPPPALAYMQPTHAVATRIVSLVPHNKLEALEEHVRVWAGLPDDLQTILTDTGRVFLDVSHGRRRAKRNIINEHAEIYGTVPEEGAE